MTLSGSEEGDRFPSHAVTRHSTYAGVAMQKPYGWKRVAAHASSWFNISHSMFVRSYWRARGVWTMQRVLAIPIVVTPATTTNSPFELLTEAMAGWGQSTRTKVLSHSRQERQPARSKLLRFAAQSIVPMLKLPLCTCALPKSLFIRAHRYSIFETVFALFIAKARRFCASVIRSVLVRPAFASVSGSSRKRVHSLCGSACLLGRRAPNTCH